MRKRQEIQKMLRQTLSRLVLEPEPFPAKKGKGSAPLKSEPATYITFSSYHKETRLASDKKGMRIQASHMNLGFMQELAARQAQGEDLGQDGTLQYDPTSQSPEIDPAQVGLTPAAEAIANRPDLQERVDDNAAPQTLGETLANEIVRRMEETDAEMGGLGEDGQPRDKSELREALGDAMDWVRERFGDEAAAAASGMVMASTSNGVTEESLGDGLLNALKLIDRNYGIAAGDAAIARFNQGVNAELNEYFDNGKNELFLASTTSVDGASATQDLNTRFFMRAVQEASSDSEETTSVTRQLLDSLKKELDETAELQNLSNQLETEFSPTLASPQQAMAAYTQTAVPAEPQFTDMAL